VVTLTQKSPENLQETSNRIQREMATAPPWETERTNKPKTPSPGPSMTIESETILSSKKWDYDGWKKQGTDAPAPFREEQGIDQGTKAPASSQEVQGNEQGTGAPAPFQDDKEESWIFRPTQWLQDKRSQTQDWKDMWPAYNSDHEDYRPEFDRSTGEEELYDMKQFMTVPFLFEIIPGQWPARLEVMDEEERKNQLYATGLYISIQNGKYIDALRQAQDCEDDEQTMQEENNRHKEEILYFREQWDKREEEWKLTYNSLLKQLEEHEKREEVAVEKVKWFKEAYEQEKAEKEKMSKVKSSLQSNETQKIKQLQDLLKDEREVVCFGWGESGHIRPKCPRAQRSRKSADTSISNVNAIPCATCKKSTHKTEDCFFTLMKNMKQSQNMTAVNKNQTPLMNIAIDSEGKNKIAFLPDTGAARTMIPVKVFEKLGLKYSTFSTPHLTHAGNTALKLVGMTDLTLYLGKEQCHVSAAVADGAIPFSLLGRDVLETYHLFAGKIDGKWILTDNMIPDTHFKTNQVSYQCAILDEEVEYQMKKTPNSKPKSDEVYYHHPMPATTTFFSGGCTQPKSVNGKKECDDFIMDEEYQRGRRLQAQNGVCNGKWFVPVQDFRKVGQIRHKSSKTKFKKCWRKEKKTRKYLMILGTS